jgi:SAM-dependent methyltransferase
MSLSSRVLQAVSPHPVRLLHTLIARERLQTGLDLGCGAWSPLAAARRLGFHSTGVDISAQAIERARGRGLHDEYLCAHAGDLPSDRTYDVVVASHLIEHLPRDEGVGLLRKLESLGRRIVYVATPNGFLEQEAYGGNPFQEHHSGWFPHDFEGRGYSVFGTSSRLWRGVRSKSIFPKVIAANLDRSIQRIVFRRPGIAHVLVAILYRDPSGVPRQL